VSLPPAPITRFDAAFAARPSDAPPGLIPYFTAGYPHLESTPDLLMAAQRVGCIAVEVGIPFSDPLADGPTIQRTGQVALGNGMTLRRALADVRAARQGGVTVPIAVMTYVNPVLSFGVDKLARDAASAGVDILVPDTAHGHARALTDMVLNDELDFAVVPAFEGTIGLKSRLLVRDREMLISGPRRGFAPLAPLRLAECAPLKFVVPGPDNIRRRNLETYFQSHGVEVAAMLEMDAMIATLEFVARTDYVTILPSVISINDVGRGELIVNPIVAPELHAEFVVIQPTRRTLSTQARLFLERFEQEVSHIHAVWDDTIAGTKRRKISA